MTAATLWNADEITGATGGVTPAGVSSTGWTVSGVSIDSRTLDPGDLFVALRGPKFDGHDHVAAAQRAGAAGALVQRVPDGLGVSERLVLVENTGLALEALGRAARGRTSARICCITGSVGKTGTKEALATALAALGSTAATRGNLNNEWGVPLSLARMPRNSAFGVFELGMNHAGELAPLSQLSRPHVAIITTVTDAHKEFFTSIEEIADAKAEIFRGMDESGIAILHRDSPHYGRLAAAAKKSGVHRIVGFGVSTEAEVRLIEHRPGNACDEIRAVIFGQEITYRLGLTGRHWAINSLAVLAAVDALGGNFLRASASLATLQPLIGRGMRHSVAVEGGSFEIIDESYNASPAAMRAAFAVLAGCIPGPNGRRIAVLGDMLELGTDTAALHAQLADYLTEAKIDLVFTAGPHMAALNAVLLTTICGGHALDSSALIQLLKDTLRAGDVVLVKGSLSSRMATVVEGLQALDRKG